MPESGQPLPVDGASASRLGASASRLRPGAAWDRAGVIVSGLCLAHCLAGIVLVGVLGLGGEVLLNPAIHRFGLVAAIAIAGATIGANALRGGRRGPLLAGLCGLSLMASAVIAGHGTAEVMLTMAGVALVALAHVANIRHHH